MSQPLDEPVMIEEYPEITPCEHMERLVSSLADDSLHGPALWYTRFHVATCSKCSAALAALRSLRARLSGYASRDKAQGALADERRAKVEEQFEEIEAARR